MREQGARAGCESRVREPPRCLLVTPEEEPLELFGPPAARAIEPMLKARGIQLRTSSLSRDRARSRAGARGAARCTPTGSSPFPRWEGPICRVFPTTGTVSFSSTLTERARCVRSASRRAPARVRGEAQGVARSRAARRQPARVETRNASRAWSRWDGDVCGVR